MDLLFILAISIFIGAIYFHKSKELRSTKCNKCNASKLSTYELNTDLHPDIRRISSMQLIFNPNNYITKLQCVKCGHIQDFKPNNK